MGLALDLQGCTDTGNGAYGQIGRQPKLCPHIRVAGLLKLHLVRGVLPPCHVRNEVAGVGKGGKRGVQFSALLGSGCKFARQGTYRLHKDNYITCERHR